VIRLFAKAAYEICAHRSVDPNWENRGRAVQQYELRVTRLDERFGARVEELFEAAREKKLWRGAAAAQSPAEYFATGVLAYFDAAGQTHAPEGAVHPITTREALRGYDPGLADLVAEVMAYERKVDWRVH
jgi:hypothetical protein